MATSTDKLLRLKAEIEQAKLDKASNEGAFNQNLKRLKDEFNCRDINEGKAELKRIQNLKTALNSKIEKAVSDLEAKYEW